MHPGQDPADDARAVLDGIVDGLLRAEQDVDLAAILAPMADGVVRDVVRSPDNPTQGLGALLRRPYCDQLAAKVHERNVPLRRLSGWGFVLDEQAWLSRLTGRAFEIDGHRRWLNHRRGLAPRDPRGPDHPADDLARPRGDPEATPVR